MNSLLPNPLHPSIVHLPVALAVLLPLLSIGAAIAARRGTAWKRWGIVVLSAALMTASGWVAQETGEDEEDKVEEVVSRRIIHEHEERAEAFVLGAGVLTVVAAAGMLAGPIGMTARVAATLGSVVVLGLGYRVGHSGGELVYKHGAASAYVTDSTSQQPAGDGVR